MDDEATGRRARNMREKRERILRAAAELFAAHGFEGVTTQQISERADIAAGTLFRYAASKGELFLMVHNEQLRTAIAIGAQAAARESDPGPAVIAQVEPVLTRARDSRGSAVYQRELLFGPPGERYRAEGLALVGDLEERIANLLGGGPEATRAARTVFAILNLLLVEPWTGVHPGSDPVEELRAQVAQVVRGFHTL
ncbi:TetR/AcrR family transcriptional regulator [Actinoplanes palleronii]|uniref:TetR/AcrR family transcriptional regulator n=1 Tax=Actinoplanes palleronii TaxID=113570 RepID=UPI001943A57A|nr:TetR/AcrR family transcriptional regulator [Actinoplanes palleronii]